MSPATTTATDTFEVVDPATEQVIGTVPDGTTTDATAAVDAAEDAARAWVAIAPRERAEILRRAFELTMTDLSTLADLITRENGKSAADARAEVAYAAEFFRWYAEEAVRTEGTYGESPAGGTRTLVSQRPVGISALVTPWNFPAAMVTRKIAPALAAGCTVVLKPARETPLTAVALAGILATAGVPAGVVNVVTTTDARGVVGAWLDDPRVRKLSFTGSTPVGRGLLERAAQRIVNTTMELGGNAPFIVAADADIEAAVTGAMIAKFRNNGQACTAANRFYVHADVRDEFVARFGAAAEALAPTPLISATARGDVTTLVDDAVTHGATVSHVGRVPGQGWFYPATVLVDVPETATILDHEIFGPVAPVVTWWDTDEMLAWVNASEMGLAAYVYSRDLRWALRVGERVEAGMVGVNRGIVSDPAAPFGGVKQSGLGREGARDGLRAFQETQYLSVDWSDA